MNDKINTNKKDLPHFCSIIDLIDNSESEAHTSCNSSTFDTAVGCIEDILVGKMTFRIITVDQVVYDNFANMQKNFLEKYWHLFENSEENKLCYMDIFSKYTTLIEVYIETELTKKIPNFFMPNFIQELIDRRNELDGEVFEMLFTLTDFLEFKQMVLDYRAIKEGHGVDLQSGIIICSLKL